MGVVVLWWSRGRLSRAAMGVAANLAETGGNVDAKAHCGEIGITFARWQAFSSKLDTAFNLSQQLFHRNLERERTPADWPGVKHHTLE